MLKEETMADEFYSKTKTGTFNFRIRFPDTTKTLFHVRTDGIIRFFYVEELKEWKKLLESAGLEIPEQKNEFEFYVEEFKDHYNLDNFLKVVKETRKIYSKTPDKTV